MDIEHEFAELCKKNGWKNTPQRFAIYSVIRENLSHPTVDHVWESVRENLPTVTRESVYRILNEFAGRGIILRMDDLNSARYDWQTMPHGHFICQVCGMIRDFALPDSLKIPSDIDRTALTHVELRLAGICPECQKKRSK